MIAMRGAGFSPRQSAPLPNPSFRPALLTRAFGGPPHAAAIPASPTRGEGLSQSHFAACPQPLVPARATRTGVRRDERGLVAPLARPRECHREQRWPDRCMRRQFPPRPQGESWKSMSAAECDAAFEAGAIRCAHCTLRDSPRRGEGIRLRHVPPSPRPLLPARATGVGGNERSRLHRSRRSRCNSLRSLHPTTLRPCVVEAVSPCAARVPGGAPAGRPAAGRRSAARALRG